MPRTAARASRKGGGQIDRDHLVPGLVAQLHKQIVAVDAGVGDQDVELAHHFFGLRHQRLDLVLVGEVAAATGTSRRVPEIATPAPCWCNERDGAADAAGAR